MMAAASPSGRTPCRVVEPSLVGAVDLPERWRGARTSSAAPDTIVNEGVKAFLCFPLSRRIARPQYREHPIT